MNRWPIKQLGEVLELSRERIEPAEHPSTLFNYIGLEVIERDTGKLLPYQPTAGAEIKSTKNVFHKNEILYGKLRPYLNKVHIASDDGICSTDIYVLRSRQGQIHPSFAANYLSSDSVLSMVSSAMAGANLPRISHEALLGILIPVPPLAEQERIVKLLNEADELRKLRAQADSRTAELIPALFHEMFETRKNRRGWRNLKLVELCDSSDDIRCGPFGTQLLRDEYQSSGVPLWSIKHVNSHFILPAFEFLTTAKAAELQNYSLFPGDVVMTRKATVGNCTVYPTDFKPGIMHSDLLRIRVNRNTCSPDFLTVALANSAEVKQQVDAVSVGATTKGINVSMLKSIFIHLPPLQLQEEFAARAAEIRELGAKQVASRRRLDELFQSLLHRAFQGEL